MRTIVYVDGFNLYYGAIAGTAHKWLDMRALFTALLEPHHQILEIKYYTANVSARPSDLGLPMRQQTYHRAIKAHDPTVSIILGHFLSSIVPMKLETPINGQTKARVHKTEEKGSDVNLALHVLNDAWRNAYDCAVIVSNDSDMAEALRIVKMELNKRIILMTPGDPAIRRPSAQLRRYAMKTISIPPNAPQLATSHLPDPIAGTTIHKPASW